MDGKLGKTFNFKLTRKLGSGAFGEIFLGINVSFMLANFYKLKNNVEVAIKLEPISAKHP